MARRFKRPKLQTCFIKELDRKVFHKDRLLLDAFKIDVVKGGDSVVYSNDVEDLNITDLINDRHARTRLISILYDQFSSVGFVSCMLRDILLNERIDLKLCESKLDYKPNKFIAMKGLVADIEKLHTITNENILLLSNDVYDRAELKERYINAVIDETAVDGKLYDLVIVSFMLCYDRKLITKLGEYISPGSILIVREFDVSNYIDKLLLNTVNIIVGNDKKTQYISIDELPSLFPNLTFNSETHVKLDTVKAPYKSYCTMLIK